MNAEQGHGTVEDRLSQRCFNVKCMSHWNQAMLLIAILA